MKKHIIFMVVSVLLVPLLGVASKLFNMSGESVLILLLVAICLSLIAFGNLVNIIFTKLIDKESPY